MLGKRITHSTWAVCIGLGHNIARGRHTIRGTGFKFSRKARLSAVRPEPAEKGNLVFRQLQHGTIPGRSTEQIATIPAPSRSRSRRSLAVGDREAAAER